MAAANTSHPRAAGEKEAPMGTSTATILSASGATFDVEFEGQRARVGFITSDPTALKASAEEALRRAEEAAFRARRMLAIAEALEAQRAEAKAQAAVQRQERAAKTRAHNADPFGFKAMEARLAEAS